MHRKVQNVAKITPLQNDHTFLTLLFNLSKKIMLQTLGRQIKAKYLRNA